MGTFLLWFGWFGFNPGSTLAITTYGLANTSARAAVTTTLSACAGGLVAMAIIYRRQRVWDMLTMCTGTLAGLAAITGGCAVVEPWAALLCGLVAGVLAVYGEDLLDWLQIDDPAMAWPVHGLCGMWGMLFTGLLASEDYVVEVYKVKRGSGLQGIFYGGHAQLLLCQFIAVCVIVGWVVFWANVYFWAVRRLHLLRLDLESEAVGLDAAAMGEAGGMPLNMTKLTDGDKSNAAQRIIAARAVAGNANSGGSHGLAKLLDGGSSDLGMARGSYGDNNNGLHASSHPGGAGPSTHQSAANSGRASPALTADEAMAAAMAKSAV
mmetsp:Transcript_13091/g.32025  ORF Transcript_13091/g.32025 Transcript_13091/m.32025 type:complete len:322 (-) Transcript_13091:129-1094(-)